MQGKITTPGSTIPAPPAPSSSQLTLPVLTWRKNSVIFTPIPRELHDFVYATRLLTWNADNVGKSFAAQDAGARHMFALWIPDHVWLAQLAAYECNPDIVARGGGKGLIYSVWKDEFVNWVDARASFPKLEAGGRTWRPVATVAADFDNIEFDLDEHFGGDRGKMQAWFACRETQVASVSMLAVVEPWQGHGLARDGMDFIEEWVLRRGWTCEDAPAEEQEVCGCAGWPVEELGGRKRRLPPVRVLALATSAGEERVNRMYLKRGYRETQVVTQEWGDCRFYVKDLW